MKIENKKFVEVSYQLHVDGHLADEAKAEQPLGFVFGEGFLIPGFEKNIEGKVVGDKFDFTLSPAEGYGESNADMVAELPRTAFEINGQVEEMYGAHVVVKAFNGEEESVAEFEKM